LLAPVSRSQDRPGRTCSAAIARGPVATCPAMSRFRRLAPRETVRSTARWNCPARNRDRRCAVAPARKLCDGARAAPHAYARSARKQGHVLESTRGRNVHRLSATQWSRALRCHPVGLQCRWLLARASARKRHGSYRRSISLPPDLEFRLSQNHCSACGWMVSCSVALAVLRGRRLRSISLLGAARPPRRLAGSWGWSSNPGATSIPCPPDALVILAHSFMRWYVRCRFTAAISQFSLMRHKDRQCRVA